MRALTHGADHAELWAGKVVCAAEPFLQRLFSLRTRIATAAVSLLAVWLFVHVMFGANGMVVYRAKRGEYQDLQKQIVQLQKENAGYSNQINQLKSDPKRIEKEAREQFHYARPGEIIYVAPDPPPAVRPDVHSASK